MREWICQFVICASIRGDTAAMAISKQLARFIEQSAPLTETGSIDVDDDLVETGLIDSLGIVRLITYICEEFGVQLSGDDVRMENFETVEAIEALILRKRD